MNDKNYILNVLTISSLPKILSFSLKLISYPLMVRAVGVSQLGVVVYLSAVITILECFVDFGATTAAGKDIAAARDQDSVSEVYVLMKWLKFQISIALISFIPFLLFTYLITFYSSTINFDIEILIILVISNWLRVFINFIRTALTSLLAFKLLVVLDILESLMQSLFWFLVATYLPTIFGLALSNIILTLLILIVGVLILFYSIGMKWPRENNELTEQKSLSSDYSPKILIYKSIDFFWLRIATRSLTSIPNIIFGKIFGADFVGIIGAYSKIIDLLNFPYGVIGYALAVRASDIVVKGVSKVTALWNMVSKVVSLSLFLSAICFIGSPYIKMVLFPNNPNSISIIKIMSILIFTNAISSTITMMSDYVDSVKSRNILISFVSIFQIPILLFVAKMYGENGSVLCLALVILITNYFYIKIALKNFFKDARFHIRKEVIYFSFTIIFALIVSDYFQRNDYVLIFAQVNWLNNFLSSIFILTFVIILSFIFNKKMRRFYSLRNILNFL